MKVLLLNAGSSSLKFTVMESVDESVVASGAAEWASEVTRYHFRSANCEIAEETPWRGQASAVKRLMLDLRQALPDLFCEKDPLQLVGHRVVHGGDITQATRITPAVLKQLHELQYLAPLHAPASLEALEVAISELPNASHIASFDTAFHTTLLPAARNYAVPRQWTNQWGVKRYGFHGLSHAYCAQRAAELLPNRRPLQLVICHLGHGCSASAVGDGVCLDTTMGFTPLEGLMMATRSGSLDPEVVLFLQRECGLTPKEISDALNRDSGLLAVSGVSSDMRVVLEAARAGNQSAQLAIEMYCHRARQAIGALAVTLGRIDALVFTAGVGENSPEIRSQICIGLECLGVRLDDQRNQSRQPDRDVATADSPARIFVLRTREDLSMLQQVIDVGQPIR